MKCADFEVKFRNIGTLLYYSDLIKGNRNELFGKEPSVWIFESVIEEMCGRAIVTLHREV